MSARSRPTLAIALVTTAAALVLGLLWAFFVPSLLRLPAVHFRTNLRAALSMGGAVALGVAGVNLLYRLRWQQRRPAELPIRQLLALLCCSTVAVLAAWTLTLHRVAAPWGVALVAAHLGTAVLVSLLMLSVSRLLLRSAWFGPAAVGRPRDEVPRLSWSRVGLRGYLLLVVVLLGVGAIALVVGFRQAQSARETSAQWSRASTTWLELMARRVERVPEPRVLATVARARRPTGIVLRVARADGRFLRAEPAVRPRPVEVHLQASGRCRLRSRPATPCRWTPLKAPHDGLALVAQSWPPSDRPGGRASVPLLLFAFGLVLFAATMAYLVGGGVARELADVAGHIRSMAAGPRQRLGEPMRPTSTDEVGELVQRLGALRRSLAAELDRAARDLDASEAVDRARTDFLEEINFALRTPLTTIIGTAELLDEGAYGALGSGQCQEVRIALESSEQLLSLVADIVDVSFAEVGGIELRLAETDYLELVRSEVTAARAQAEGRDVALRVELPDDLAPVRADGARVRRVLANLLSNAVKFTSSGEVVVTVNAGEADTVETCVRDTGVGIADEHQARIFERYRQAPGERPRHLRGSGLGLAIVQQLVRLHGGRVWLESTLGEGSAFSFTLPLQGPPDGAPARVSEDKT